jgi:predicted amidophosphoribosyltransferase
MAGPPEPTCHDCAHGCDEHVRLCQFCDQEPREAGSNACERCGVQVSESVNSGKEEW